MHKASLVVYIYLLPCPHSNMERQGFGYGDNHTTPPAWPAFGPWSSISDMALPDWATDSKTCDTYLLRTALPSLVKKEETENGNRDGRAVMSPQMRYSEPVTDQ
ncbi:hypothetical protein CLAIMM_13505 [Cladophialophora immunda]|nr:hypothetical protein CLAIMM_13505 [Cladophialophora immunda]